MGIFCIPISSLVKTVLRFYENAHVNVHKNVRLVNSGRRCKEFGFDNRLSADDKVELSEDIFALSYLSLSHHIGSGTHGDEKIFVIVEFHSRYRHSSAGSHGGTGCDEIFTLARPEVIDA